MRKQLIIYPLVLIALFAVSGCNILPSNTISEEAKNEIAFNPVIDEQAQTVSFGMYPQSRVMDENLISTLEKTQPSNINGWYSYQNAYYAKSVGKISGTKDDQQSWSRKFSNGEEIEVGKTYWFKCEPIVWNIVSADDSKYVLMTNDILELHCFDVVTNNYANSEVRTWMNNIFYKTIFALNNTDKILTSEVDNSAQQTDKNSANLACENTQDKLYLPSYAEISGSANAANSFMPNGLSKLSDYAFAQGAYKTTIDDRKDCGHYWLRSPSKTNNNQASNQKAAWFFTCSGYFYSWDVDGQDIGVRPMMSIAK